MPKPTFSHSLDLDLDTQCGGTLAIGWDAQDPSNEGVAFWFSPAYDDPERNPMSGAIESQADLDAVITGYEAITD